MSTRKLKPAASKHAAILFTAYAAGEHIWAFAADWGRFTQGCLDAQSAGMESDTASRSRMLIAFMRRQIGGVVVRTLTHT